MTLLIDEIFDAENFRKEGHKIIDYLADYLSSVDENKVRTNSLPEDELEFWQNFMTTKNDQFIPKLIEKSIHLHNKRYLGHQVSTVAPYISLLDLTTSLLNNGMAVYEMGSAASAIEKWVVDNISRQIGFKNGDGFLTSGGTLATLTAILTARNIAKIEKSEFANYFLLTSSQTHYCAERAASILGLGGVVKIDTTEDFKINIQNLEQQITKIKNGNKKILAIIGSACSTSTGSYDDLESIADICEKEKIWFHVDGAHGGCVVSTNKYKRLARGIERADSVIIDLHKMYLTPALATLVAFKESKNSYLSFQQDAEYLWDSSDPDWFNFGKRTFECTKLMMGVKLYGFIHKYGWDSISQHIEYLYDLAQEFSEIISNDPKFELATTPESNIVCFRYIGDNENQEAINKTLHQKVIENGDFYIVKTELQGKTFLRTTLMNPLTTNKELKELLNYLTALTYDTTI